MNTSNQKSFIILIAFFLILSRGVSAAETGIVLEDFSSYKNGKIPDEGWRSRNGDSQVVYKVLTENQNFFLQAIADKTSIQLFREKGWSLKNNPVFSWRWRVHMFPTNSNEDTGKNDSAVGVYVVFPKRWFIPETIKYVWSEKVPVGTVIQRQDHFPLLVIRSGTADKDKWITEERNVYEDYKKIFNRSPADPVAFGVLTDANDTNSKAIGDYSDFKVLPAQPKK